MSLVSGPGVARPPAAANAATTKPAPPQTAVATKPTASSAPKAAATPPAPAAAPTAAAAKPAAPALPTVWELPYATRKDLPTLALTMHVYSSVPTERFIVLEGVRHIEGDDLGNGVTLHEISADGMVLDFKGQRFVYPRDSR
jgi:general secretion pathway protein B